MILFSIIVNGVVYLIFIFFSSFHKFGATKKSRKALLRSMAVVLFQLIKIFVLSEFSHFCIEIYKNGFYQNFRFNNKVKSKCIAESLVLSIFRYLYLLFGDISFLCVQRIKIFSKNCPLLGC